MGLMGGANNLANAGAETFETDPKPLPPTQACAKGKTLLKAHLFRRDTNKAIEGEEIDTSGKAKLNANSAGATGLADFGTVDPGTYTFSVKLSQGLKPKYLDFKPRDAAVPELVDFHATLKLDPRARLKIVLLDSKGKEISGAKWALTSPVKAKGTTPASGLIDVEVPWDSDSAELDVDLPEPSERAPKAKDAKKPNKKDPEYPIIVDPARYKKPEIDSQHPDLKIKWTLGLAFLKDTDNADGWKKRLHNIGFPADTDPVTQRSVKAYQRIKDKNYAGSGVLADISGSLKTLHDTV